MRGVVDLTREEMARKMWGFGWRLSFATLALGGSGAGLLLLWVSALLGGAKLRLPRSVLPLMVPLGIWMVVTSFFAQAPAVAFAASLGSWLMILTAFSVNEDTPSFEELTRLCFFGAIAAALVAYSAPLRGLRRAGAFVGVNAFGTTIFLGTALGLIYLNSAPERKKWQLPFLLLMGVAELLTFSRGGWLGFLTMCLVFYLGDKKAVAVLILLALLFSSLAFLWPPLAERGKSMISFAANQDRVRIYRRTLQMIKDHPLLGIGAGNFPGVYEAYSPPDQLVYHAHSIYLSTLVELGVPGGILFLLLLGRVVAAAWRCRATLMGRGILAAILGCLVHGLFDVTIFGIHVGMAFWALGGIAFFLESMFRKTSKEAFG